MTLAPIMRPLAAVLLVGILVAGVSLGADNKGIRTGTINKLEEDKRTDGGSTGTLVNGSFFVTSKTKVTGRLEVGKKFKARVEFSSAEDEDVAVWIEVE